MGMTAKNLWHGLRLNQRSQERYQNKLDGRKDGSPDPNAPKPSPEEDGMRIDSDNIQYHVYPDRPATSEPVQIKSPSPLIGIAKMALLASGFGIPAALAIQNLPAIINAFKGPAPVASVPSTPSGNLLQDYDLLVGPPK